MNARKWFNTIAASTGCLGLFLPNQNLNAASPALAAPPAETATTYAQPSANVAAPVLDLQLQAGGVLTGRVTDSHGAPLAGMPVVLDDRGLTVAQAATDANGSFACQGIRGGVYELKAADSSSIVRLWAPETAPPGAKQAILVVADRDVVAGNYHGAKFTLANPIVVAGVTTAAVGAAVWAGVAHHDNHSGS